jgi:hypothetical protein
LSSPIALTPFHQCSPQQDNVPLLLGNPIIKRFDVSNGIAQVPAQAGVLRAWH